MKYPNFENSECLSDFRFQRWGELFSQEAIFTNQPIKTGSFVNNGTVSRDDEAGLNQCKQELLLNMRQR